MMIRMRVIVVVGGDCFPHPASAKFNIKAFIVVACINYTLSTIAIEKARCAASVLLLFVSS